MRAILQTLCGARRVIELPVPLPPEIKVPICLPYEYMPEESEIPKDVPYKIRKFELINRLDGVYREVWEG